MVRHIEPAYTIVYFVGILILLQIRARSQCHKIIFFMTVLLILSSWQYFCAKVQRSAWFLVGGGTGGQA
jgi:hypothetical protein